MIFYNPLDGQPFTSIIAGKLRTCFLMTQLGAGMPPGAAKRDARLRKQAQRIRKAARFMERARNSVEILATNF